MSSNAANASPTDSAPSEASTEQNKQAPKPWDKLPNEKAIWYARFQAFIRLGPNRTVEALYRDRKRVEKKLASTRPTGAWHAKAREFRWEDRAAAHDAFKQQEIIEQEEPRKIEARELRREIVEGLLKEVHQAIGKAELATMDLKEARRYLPHLFKALNDLLTAYRLEMGEPTVIEKSDNTTSIEFNADDLAEARRQLEELYS